MRVLLCLVDIMLQAKKGTFFAFQIFNSKEYSWTKKAELVSYTAYNRFCATGLTKKMYNILSLSRNLDTNEIILL